MSKVKDIPAAAPNAAKPAPQAPEIRITGADREFLPAALEILETPPSPLPVAILMTLCAFIAIAVAWAFIGRMEVHAVGQGKVETPGRSKIVQPIDSGRVTAIAVQTGARVKAGDIVIQLDPSEARADEKLYTEATAALSAEIARRRVVARLASALPEVALFPPPAIPFAATVSDSVRAREVAVMMADLSSLRDTLLNNDKQVAQKLAARARLESSIEHQTHLISTLQDRVGTRQEAIKLSVGTKINLYDALESLDRSRAQLASDRGQLVETDAAVVELQAQRARMMSQFVADQTTRLADAEKKFEEASQYLAKARVRVERTSLAAPIDGIVQQLAVTTVGQVVTTGQQLMTIVPEDAAVQVEIFLPNKDIGFVRPGQEAVIKVDAFNFTRFGTLRGKVVQIASEAIDEQEARRIQANATSAAAPQASANGQPANFVFPITVALSDRKMKIDGIDVPLSAGMTVTAEIVTDTRRIVDYFLSPLSRTTSEALKER